MTFKEYINNNNIPYNIENLNIWNSGLTDIKGIEEYTNLINLDLFRNNISDISPIKNLTNLTDLHLSKNNISDLSPIIYLYKLSNIYIKNNNLPPNYPSNAIFNKSDINWEYTLDTNINFPNEEEIFVDESPISYEINKLN